MAVDKTSRIAREGFEYWVHGEGAVKIRWGTDGSFDRCVHHLTGKVRDPKGLCAEYHKAATGEWPAEKGVESALNPTLFDIAPGSRLGWRGLLAPIGKPTGDGREFAIGSLSHRQLPLPLTWQRQTKAGSHDGSVIIGSMEEIVISRDAVAGGGELFTVDHGVMPRLAEDLAEVKFLLEKGVIGPSVELDDHVFAWKDNRALITKGRITNATLLPVPAFAEARSFEIFEIVDDGVGQLLLASGSPFDLVLLRQFITLRAWLEQKHPRDWKGRFRDKPGAPGNVRLDRGGRRRAPEDNEKVSRTEKSRLRKKGVDLQDERAANQRRRREEEADIERQRVQRQQQAEAEKAGQQQARQDDREELLRKIAEMEAEVAQLRKARDEASAELRQDQKEEVGWLAWGDEAPEDDAGLGKAFNDVEPRHWLEGLAAQFEEEDQDRKKKQQRINELVTQSTPTKAEDLETAIQGGARRTAPFSEGATAETNLVIFNDGTRAVHKRFEAYGFDASPQEMADAEFLASKVAAAIGVNAPTMHRQDETALYMTFLDGEMAMDFGLTGAAKRRIAGSDQGLLVGLMDVIIHNYDRHDGNWLLEGSVDEPQIGAIDHGLAFFRLGKPDAYQPNAEAPDLDDNDFAVNYVSGGRWIPNELTPEDVKTIKERLLELAADFDDLGRQEWLMFALERLDQIGQHAKGTRSIVA